MTMKGSDSDAVVRRLYAKDKIFQKNNKNEDAAVQSHLDNGCDKGMNTGLHVSALL
jgi:hypothetical protein